MTGLVVRDYWPVGNSYRVGLEEDSYTPTGYRGLNNRTDVVSAWATRDDEAPGTASARIQIVLSRCMREFGPEAFSVNIGASAAGGRMYR